MNVTPSTPTIDANDTLNLIVARYPRALSILQQFGLDTCCGGALTLQTAADHHNLELAHVLATLHAALKEDQAS